MSQVQDERRFNKPAMKVLFLDVDGVLNCEETFKHHTNSIIGIDPFMGLLVNRIVEATGAKVVLSSSWRGSEENEANIERAIGTKLFGRTPRFSHFQIRGQEINKWISDYPQVRRYAILDDDADMLPSQMKNFFKTSFKSGLTEDMAQRVINHLNKYD